MIPRPIAGLFLAASAVALNACVSPTAPISSVATASANACLREKPPFGTFTGPFHAELLDSGRKIKLLREMRFTEKDSTVWIAPEGSIVDGASIPKAFWSVIGGPLDGPYRKASVFHDVACENKDRAWPVVHCMFFKAMRASNVDKDTAKIMFTAVARFGPRWDDPKPRKATTEDAQAVKAWVEQTDPSLRQILSSPIPGTDSPPVVAPPVKPAAQ